MGKVPRIQDFSVKTCPSLSPVCLSVRYCPAFSQGKGLHAATRYRVLEHRSEGGQGGGGTVLLSCPVPAAKQCYIGPLSFSSAVTMGQCMGTSP